MQVTPSKTLASIEYLQTTTEKETNAIDKTVNDVLSSVIGCRTKTTSKVSFSSLLPRALEIAPVAL